MSDDLIARLRNVRDHLADEAADRLAALEAENADLKSSVVAFGGPWAVQFAKMHGLPDKYLHQTHYDILKAAGARMDDFIRHEDTPEARHD
jgi:hypothetical protein